MTIGLCLIIIVLLLTVTWQYYRQRTERASLLEIQQELERIIDEQTNERLLLQTDSKEIQQFLIQINQLLDDNQKVSANYQKAKLELGKMLSNMSHDLKTPLTVILGYVEKLKMSKHISEEERHSLTLQLHKKTEAVIALINQFFDLVKLESGDHLLPMNRMNLNEVCRQNVLDFYEQLQAKALHVQIEIPEEPSYILGNEEALNRVLNNLISNAIDYGNEGQVFGLTVQAEGKSVILQVWDKGRGIPDSDQNRVFERLYTLDDARNQTFKRSGLGLSITKRLVEVMKGTLHLESKPYEKTVFTCTFKKISY